MKHIRFPESIDVINQRLPFFLATEEWVARRMPEGDYFFSWRVDPTVICGRNQEIDKEVDLEYCRRNGIDVVRRRSGGGAVFADRENFMFSFITSGDDVTVEFARYTSMIADALHAAGIDAEATGRNDLVINGKKVAGNAFYHIPGRCIAHGTMLYDFDPKHLASALTPSKAKMESKGVKSVPKRVTCLKDEGIGLTPEEFEKFMIERITDDSPYEVTPADYEEIKSIEAGYYDPSFMRIKSASDSGVEPSGEHVCNTTRIDGLGEFCIDYDVVDHRISGFRITGDFFMNEDVESLICKPLEGVSHDAAAVREAVGGIAVADAVPGLTAEALADLILGKK